MTSVKRPKCMECMHFHLTETALACAVFDSGIPNDILLGARECDKHESILPPLVMLATMNPAVGNEPREGT